MVTALRQEWAGGRRRLVNAGRVGQTNDLGQFRIYGLPPGDYYVSATSGTRRHDLATCWAGCGRHTIPRAPRHRRPATRLGPTQGPPPPPTPRRSSWRPDRNAGHRLRARPRSAWPGQRRRPQLRGQAGRGHGGLAEPPHAAGKADWRSDGTGAGRTNREGTFTLNGVAPGDYNFQVRGLTIITSGGGDTMMFSARVGAAEVTRSSRRSRSPCPART